MGAEGAAKHVGRSQESGVRIRAGCLLGAEGAAKHVGRSQESADKHGREWDIVSFEILIFSVLKMTGE